MGGILTDASGRTSVDGLWAAGEVASTGVHGANRLASNSLLEAVVFAARIADALSGTLPAPSARGPGRPAGESDDPVIPVDSTALGTLRQLMSAHVGVIRNKDGLISAIRALQALERRTPRLRFANILTTAKMMAAAALAREESRGGHYRSDCPEPRAAWQHRSLLTLAEAETILADAAESRAA